MKDAILIYDIPRESHSVAVQVLRDLQKINAKMIHHSTWKSNKVKDLIDIAILIKKSGGNASILEEKLIF